LKAHSYKHLSSSLGATKWQEKQNVERGRVLTSAH